jgi:X-Pro dipeptidyl-peptidase
VTEPRYAASEPEELYVEVELTFEDADGEEVTETPTLYGEVIRPLDDAGEAVEDVPVILTYTPYGDLYQALNDGDSPAKDGIASYFVPRGYARVMVDLIGCRNSGGYYDYGGIRERLSGRELVDALGEMAWTNGNVGMIGGSYDGTTQFAAAIEAPEHLEAIVPQVAIDRWYDYRYFGGCPRSTVGTPTLFDFGFAAVPPKADDPVHDAEVTATRLEPGRRAEFERRSYEYAPSYDDFWVEREYRRRAENVDCAVMIEGGWEDRNVVRWGSTRFYEALAEAGHEDRRLVMGDWPHASGQYPDVGDLYHAWFDHWLVDGVETDVMALPPVDVESASTPRQQFEAWPPTDVEEYAVPLVRSDADAAELELVGTGLATWEDRSPPVTEAEMFEERGSGDRYLMFETPELEEPVRFTGRVTADLLAASSADTWYTAVVYERRADGSVRPFARGAWNSRYRAGETEEPRATPTDRAYRVGVECWDINWEVAAGSRLGLVVASDNDDYVRHDPSNRSTNELVLGESALRFEGLDGPVDAPTFPDVSLSRETDGSVYTAGDAARVTIGVEEASHETLVRDPVPDGWDVLAGDDHEVVEIAGTTYVEFDAPATAGETRTYVAETPEGPEATDEHVFDRAEYSPNGDLWAPADGTSASVYVVGVDV